MWILLIMLVLLCTVHVCMMNRVHWIKITHYCVMQKRWATNNLKDGQQYGYVCTYVYIWMNLNEGVYKEITLTVYLVSGCEKTLDNPLKWQPYCTKTYQSDILMIILSLAKVTSQLKSLILFTNTSALYWCALLHVWYALYDV